MKHRLIASFLALAVIAAACGDDTTNTAEPAGADTSQADTATQPSSDAGGSTTATTATADPAACNVQPPDDSVTVNVYGWTFDIMDFYASELKKCGDVDNINVEVQLLDSVTVAEGVRLALSSGGESPYDIIHAANTELVEFGLEGWLQPLDDLIDKYRDKYNLDDISAKAWEGGTGDGKIYGVPVVGNTLHLAYRSDLFDKYGIKVPTTYDEVIDACHVLKDEPSIDVPFAMDVSAGWAWELEFFEFLRSFGGDFLNPDGTPAFNGPEGIAAAEKLKEVVDACMGDAHLNYGYETNEVSIGTGAIAFTQIWAANTNSMVDPKTSNFADLIKFAPAPAPKPGGLLGGSAWNDYYVIPVGTTIDPDLLFRIIMESTDLESQQQAAEFGIVTRSSVESALPNAPAAIESIEHGVGIYEPVAGTPIVRAVLANWLPFIGTGEMTAQEALDAAAKEYTTQATQKGVIGG